MPQLDRLLGEATISPRALREFAALNPDVAWEDTATVLYERLLAGRPRRRNERHQRRQELVWGTSVPVDYLEIVLRGRQAAVIRKDRLGETIVTSVRAIGRVVDADQQPGRRRRARQRAA